MSDKNLEQWINVKFYVQIRKTAGEMLALLIVAYGEYTMKKSSVFEWHTQFKEGQDVQDDPRSGQAKMQRTDANVDKVQTMVRSNQILGVRLIAEELNMNMETVQQIIMEDLGMRKILELWPDKWTHNCDNAPVVLRVHKFLAKKSITKMYHQIYSLDLAPCDFWFFPNLKNALMGQICPNIPDIQHNMTMLLRGVLANNFEDCWWCNHHLTKRIVSQGEYFEGERSC
ncbi:hypothetical protein B7P43_G00413 [Cryptotermes secundus]|uniref:Mos1 transposase HTH domain-containing protein n=1 Tax=Cryptotermes secundus TaxID=105785 RepID=A0A2J7R8J4_9NEOP|nr:hypothetical protein B7P43_G00413 [Cryptotermes secundus]